jgi:hypothetical protein
VVTYRPVHLKYPLEFPSQWVLELVLPESVLVCVLGSDHSTLLSRYSVCVCVCVCECECGFVCVCVCVCVENYQHTAGATSYRYETKFARIFISVKNCFFMY